VTIEIREEIKNFLESNENENTTYQNLGHSKDHAKGKVYSYKWYIKKKKSRNFSNKQSNNSP
jgi:hypothetical protein